MVLDDTVGLPYKPAPAREGFRELVRELGKRENHVAGTKIFVYILSAKWASVTLADGMQPKCLKIRSISEFALSCRCGIASGDPIRNSEVEVLQTEDGKFRFREGPELSSASELTRKLIRQMAEA